MPDAGIKEMTARMALIGEKIILMNGGKRITENGKDYYLINKKAGFVPPLELPAGPNLVLQVGQAVTHDIKAVGDAKPFQWKILNGELPDGIQFQNGKVTGAATKTGLYTVDLQVRQGDKKAVGKFVIEVTGKNLAPAASKILSNVMKINTATRDLLWHSVPQSLYADNIEVIRDGVTKGKGATYFSIDGTTLPKSDYYGYEWTTPQDIARLTYYTGAMEEIAGWFTSLNVEYLDDAGKWKPVDKLVTTPALIGGNQPYNKPHFVEYTMSFKPVKTTAIRMIGDAGGGEHWYSKKAYFTSISELAVFGR